MKLKPDYASLIVVSVLALSQTACLRTRGMIREGQSFDVDSGASQAQKTSADAYMIDELKAEIARLSGRLEELERAKAEAPQTAEPDPRLKAYEDRIVELEKAQLAMIEAIKGQKPVATATSPGATGSDAPAAGGFEKAKALFQAGKFDAAAEMLSQYLSQAGKAKNAAIEEALQLLAESHFLLKQYQQAIVEYSKIQERFPKSKRIPGALLRIAQSFEAMGFAEDARGFYQELTDRFPKSPEAKKAGERQKSKKSKPAAKAST